MNSRTQTSLQSRCKNKSAKEILFEKEITDFPQIFEENEMSFDEFINATDTTISAEENEIRKQGRAKYITAIIIAMINEFVQEKNKTEQITQSQIGRAATRILTKYPHLHVSDLRLFLVFLEDSRYGKIFELDSSTFLTYMDRYWEERYTEHNEWMHERIVERERAARERLSSEECVPAPEGFYERMMEKLNIVDINKL